MIIITNQTDKEMKHTNRFSFGIALQSFILVTILSGCIIVVEEDSDRHRRYLQGTAWTLEVVFYKTETLVTQGSELSVQFDDDGR